MVNTLLVGLTLSRIIWILVLIVLSKSDARGETTLIKLLRCYTHCHYADTRPQGVKQWRVKLQASA